jgi:uncharacterized protein (DUF433 family)
VLGFRNGAQAEVSVRLGRGEEGFLMTQVVLDSEAMDKQALLSRISINPNVCFGKPCIRGTRIWVSLVLDLLATGSSEKDLLEEYPQLTEDDIRACLLYGAETARGRYFEVPVEAGS